MAFWSYLRASRSEPLVSIHSQPEDELVSISLGLDAVSACSRAFSLLAAALAEAPTEGKSGLALSSLAAAAKGRGRFLFKSNDILYEVDKYFDLNNQEYDF